MNDGQWRPTRLAVPQPVVNPLPRVRSGRVRVQAGCLVHHEQMVVFKNHAGQHAPMKSWKHTRTEGWISNELRQSLCGLDFELRASFVIRHSSFGFQGDLPPENGLEGTLAPNTGTLPPGARISSSAR